MKITHNKVGQNLNLRDSSKADRSSTSSPTGSTGSAKGSSAAPESALSALGSSQASHVDISSKAQDIKKARELAMAVPDVDEAKVARLQGLIDSGSYKVDADAVADRMISEHLNWE